MSLSHIFQAASLGFVCQSAMYLAGKYGPVYKWLLAFPFGALFVWIIGGHLAGSDTNRAMLVTLIIVSISMITGVIWRHALRVLSDPERWAGDDFEDRLILWVMRLFTNAIWLGWLLYLSNLIGEHIHALALNTRPTNLLEFLMVLIGAIAEITAFEKLATAGLGMMWAAANGFPIFAQLYQDFSGPLIEIDSVEPVGDSWWFVKLFVDHIYYPVSIKGYVGESLASKWYAHVYDLHWETTTPPNQWGVKQAIQEALLDYTLTYRHEVNHA